MFKYLITNTVEIPFPAQPKTILVEKRMDKLEPILHLFGDEIFIASRFGFSVCAATTWLQFGDFDKTEANRKLLALSFFDPNAKVNFPPELKELIPFAETVTKTLEKATLAIRLGLNLAKNKELWSALEKNRYDAECYLFCTGWLSAAYKNFCLFPGEINAKIEEKLVSIQETSREIALNYTLS